MTELLSVGLQSLAHMAWLERTLRCAKPSNPTVDELWPTDTEREEMLDVIVMADTLASGVRGVKRAKALAAVAKALACLSLCPGGVPFLGTRYVSENLEGRLVLNIYPDPKYPI